MHKSISIVSIILVSIFGHVNMSYAEYDFLAQIHYQAAGKPRGFQNYLDRNRDKINNKFWSCFSSVKQNFFHQARMADENCKRYNVQNCQNLALSFYQWMENIEPVLEGRLKFKDTVMYKQGVPNIDMFGSQFLENNARMAMPYFKCN